MFSIKNEGRSDVYSSAVDVSLMVTQICSIVVSRHLSECVDVFIRSRVVWQWVFIVRSSALNPSKGTLVNQVNNPSKGSG